MTAPTRFSSRIMTMAQPCAELKPSLDEASRRRPRTRRAGSLLRSCSPIRDCLVHEGPRGATDAFQLQIFWTVIGDAGLIGPVKSSGLIGIDRDCTE